jgi:hypothetical protein
VDVDISQDQGRIAPNFMQDLIFCASTEEGQQTAAATTTTTSGYRIYERQLLHFVPRYSTQTTSNMADLMFSLGQTKGKKKTAAKVKQTKDQLKDVKITDTVESAVRKDQHDREIKSKETARNQIKANMNVVVTDTVESGIRKEQHTREIKSKETARNQIKENMNVTVTDTVESGIRKEQHTREIKAKETARNQIKENTNFDMARSLFGGGGGEEEYEEDEEAEEEE